MDLRSKTVSNPIDNSNNTPDPTKPKMPTTPKFESLTVDEKLNMLLTGMQKLESVPDDITSLRDSVKGIQNDIKEIPILKRKVVSIEVDIADQKLKTEKIIETNVAIEASLTATQKDVDDIKKQMLGFKSQLLENQKHVATLENKISRDELKIQNLTKKALNEEISKSNTANMVEIQGVPENPRENVRLIARQILHDTGVRVEQSEIDEVYRSGRYNKQRIRPIIVTFTRTATRNEVLRNRLAIKRNPRCNFCYFRPKKTT